MARAGPDRLVEALYITWVAFIIGFLAGMIAEHFAAKLEAQKAAIIEQQCVRAHLENYL